MLLPKNYRFSSERLGFRGIEEKDADDIVRWRSDARNYEFCFNSQPLTVEVHRKWFERYLADETRNDFVIVDPSGVSIGTCALSRVSNAGCEISYMIGEVNERGKGYAAETVRALTELAFEKLGMETVEARIIPGNKASIHIVEKNGYVEQERVYRIRREEFGE